MRCMLLASAALATTPAYAQSPSADPAPPAAEAPSTESAPADEGDDIVVTARRRDEQLQDVPLAISVLG